MHWAQEERTAWVGEKTLRRGLNPVKKSEDSAQRLPRMFNTRITDDRIDYGKDRRKTLRTALGETASAQRALLPPPGLMSVTTRRIELLPGL